MTRRTSPPDMLAAIGRALYGEHWRRPLADDLGEHERQIRRYVNGETLTAEHELFVAALDVLRRRGKRIAELTDELARWLKA